MNGLRTVYSHSGHLFDTMSKYTSLVLFSTQTKQGDANEPSNTDKLKRHSD